MENKSVEESIITALDGEDVKIIKYLPYILQDFWDIGTPPEDIIEIIKKHKNNYAELTLLDLGSGKGAVSVNAASVLKCKCFGIDAMEDFVAFANNKAQEFSVSGICTFETNDIRGRLKTLGKYDIIVLGAIGTVFGDYYSTLKQIEPHLNNDGIIIINDAYIEDDRAVHDGGDTDNYPNVFKKIELLGQAESAGMELVDIIADDDPAQSDELDEEFKKELNNLKKRCAELSEKYPEDKNIFSRFIEKQTREYEILTSEIVPAIFVFKRII